MTSLPRTASPLTARRVIAGAAVGCAAALAAGCASASSTPAGAAAPATAASSTPAQAEASGSASAAAGNTPSPVAAASSAAGSASAVAQGAQPCATTSLRVTTGAGQGTAGSTYIALDFTNVSGSTCTLYGYPGVALAGGSPVRQIGAAAARSRALPPRLVTLAAGATGNALLKITDARNYPVPNCRPVSSEYIQVYPPNQFTRVYVRFASTACSKQLGILTIGVVQPGTGG